MKHLSYILALWVLLLSTVPSFLQDKCLFHCNDTACNNGCSENGTCSCNDECCCSPFLHCNTCTGCPIPKMYQAVTAKETPLHRQPCPLYKEKVLPSVLYSIWQPPKLAKA